MNSVNGKTKEIGRRRGYGGTQPESERMGGAGQESQSDGTIKIKVSREDRDGRDINWKLAPVRDSIAGKILERLEALEKRHLEYVHSHQARLKARLGESEEAENEFKEESSQIKSDIYHLASREKIADEIIQVE